MLISLFEITVVLRLLVAEEALAKFRQKFGLTTFAVESTHQLHAYQVQLRVYFRMSNQ